jgi:hypothetical protein
VPQLDELQYSKRAIYSISASVIASTAARATLRCTYDLAHPQAKLPPD